MELTAAGCGDIGELWWTSAWMTIAEGDRKSTGSISSLLDPNRVTLFKCTFCGFFKLLLAGKVKRSRAGIVNRSLGLINGLVSVVIDSVGEREGLKEVEALNGS